MINVDFTSLIRSLASQVKMLEQLKFFSEDELQGIKSHRKYYERTLSRDSTTCEDVLDYLRYELDLLAIVREKKVDESLLKKKNTVTYCAGNFLNKLFSILTGHFPKEIQLWFLYVKFCQGMKDTITLLNVIENFVKVHRDKPCVFQIASRCAREDLRNVDKARDYIASGIRIHMESCELYKEAFFLELDLAKEKYAILTQGDQVPKIEEPLTKTIEFVYDAARLKIHNVDFFLDLFHSVRGLPFVKDLENRIQEDLQELFPREETMWDTLAKIKLEQLKVPTNQPNFRNIIEEVVGMYKTALEKHLNTPTMWSMYIDRVLEIYNDSSVDLSKFKKNCVLMAFTAAYHKNHLNEKHYLIWAELQKDEERKLQLLRKGAAKLHSSVPLWTKMITTRLAMNNEDDAWRVFEDSVVNFRNDKSASLSLWKLMLRYYQCVRPDKVSWCFEQGIKSSCVSPEMKPMYLEWTTLTRGILAGRKLYSEISCSRPYSAALHEKMIELENYQVKLNIKSLRQAHALLTEHFGTNDVAVWMKWINFENNVTKSRKNVLRIKDRAMKCLQPALIDEFSSEVRFFEISCLTAAKARPDVQKFNKSSCEVGNKRKVSSTKNDGNKRKKLRH
uniref:U3 small nucleolar RNA-associated protein 6 n=2 Tax=Lygus hesperus TaxID=30085 RepID=A0A0A9VTS0_LYGHE